jgi:hypothetical protein
MYHLDGLPKSFLYRKKSVINSNYCNFLHIKRIVWDFLNEAIYLLPQSRMNKNSYHANSSFRRPVIVLTLVSSGLWTSFLLDAET